KIRSILGKVSREISTVASLLERVAGKMFEDPTYRSVKGEGKKPAVWSVSRNRTALPAIAKSVPAVKADAATTLFKVDCSEIAWPVLDSGIDGDHPAFLKANGDGQRVIRSFDFRNFRKIVSLSNLKSQALQKNLAELMRDQDRLMNPPGDPKGALE